MTFLSRSQRRDRRQGLRSLMILLLVASLPLSVISDDNDVASSSSLLKHNKNNAAAVDAPTDDHHRVLEEENADCSTAESCEKCIDLAKEKIDGEMTCIWKKDENSCEEIAKDDVGDDDNKCGDDNDEAATVADGAGGDVDGEGGNADGTGGNEGNADGTGDGDVGAKSKKDEKSDDGAGEKSNKDDEDTTDGAGGDQDGATVDGIGGNEGNTDGTADGDGAKSKKDVKSDDGEGKKSNKDGEDTTDGADGNLDGTGGNEGNADGTGDQNGMVDDGEGAKIKTDTKSNDGEEQKADDVTISPTTFPSAQPSYSPTESTTEAQNENVDGAGGADGMDGASSTDGVDGAGGDGYDGNNFGGGGGSTMDGGGGGGDEDAYTEIPTASPVQQTNDQQQVTTPAPTPKSAPITYDDDDSGPIGAIMALFFMIACGVLAFKNRNKFFELMDKAGGPGGPGGGFGGGFGSGSNSRHVAAKYHEVASDDDEEWGWGDDGIGDDTQVELAPSFTKYSDDSSVNKRKKASPSTSTSKPFGNGKSPPGTNNTHVPRLPKQSQTSGPKGMSLSKAKPAMPLGSPPAPTADLVPSAPPASAPVPDLATTMPGGMRITSLGKKKPTAPKKQPTKPPPSAEDDIFASMGFSAKPAFSHNTPTPRTTTMASTGSRWNTTTAAATGASPAMTFGSSRPATSTATTSFTTPATTSSAMKADSFADDDWGDDDDLDDLLDD